MEDYDHESEKTVTRLISFICLNSQRLEAEILFHYLLMILVGLVLLGLFVLLLRKVLILIFGERIRRWIDPEPLIR
jgi:hypothetical protein